jgi:hypothetical protein
MTLVLGPKLGSFGLHHPDTLTPGVVMTMAWSLAIVAGPSPLSGSGSIWT